MRSGNLASFGIGWAAVTATVVRGLVVRSCRPKRKNPPAPTNRRGGPCCWCRSFPAVSLAADVRPCGLDPCASGKRFALVPVCQFDAGPFPAVGLGSERLKPPPHCCERGFVTVSTHGGSARVGVLPRRCEIGRASHPKGRPSLGCGCRELPGLLFGVTPACQQATGALIRYQVR